MKVSNTNTVFESSSKFHFEKETTRSTANEAVPPSTHLSWREKFSRFVYGSLGFSSAYHLFDLGLANLLALDILKHGTSLKNYFSISFSGADPSRGGTSETQYYGWNEKTDWGSCVNYAEDAKNKFFVMHETDRSNETDSGTQGPCMGVQLPMAYSNMANSNSTGGRTPLTILLDFITPVLRFKFIPADFKANFKPDKTMPKGCFYTEKPISPMHLGITGSVTQGINPRMFSRMIQHPSRVLRGVVFLGAAAYIGKRTYRYITSKPQPQTSLSQLQEPVLSPKAVTNPEMNFVICELAQSPNKAALSDEAAKSPTTNLDLAKQQKSKPSIGMRIRNTVANGLFFRVIAHQFIAFM